MQSLALDKMALIKTYVGEHSRTNDYQFQERMRRVDLAIKNILEDREIGKTVFVNGWGQVMAAIWLLDEESNIQISDVFRKYLAGHLEEALKHEFPKQNVRKQTKSIMMYPHAGKYYDWKKLGISQVYTKKLNDLLADISPRYAIHEGKLYLNLNKGSSENTIFHDLWKTDFKEKVQEKGFVEMEPNNEHPHITLINSDVIASIRTAFDSKYGEKANDEFELFMKDLLKDLNTQLAEEFSECKFGDFFSVYSEDYTPFEFCVIAKFEAPCVEKHLQKLVDKVKEGVDFIPKVRVKSSFHMTVCVEYRKADQRFSNKKDLKRLVDPDNVKMQKFSSIMMKS